MARGKRIAIGCLSSAVVLLVAALFCVAYLLGIVSCTNNNVRSNADYNPGYAVAVIETSRQKPSTFIDFYDKDLNLVASIEYPYMATQSPWGAPAVYDGVVYMTPQGKGFLANSSFVAALDMETGVVSELDADGGVSNVAASDCYVFAAAQGGVGRIDRQSGEVLSVNQKGRNFPFAFGQRLYVFNDMRVPLEDERAYLVIYDVESMEVIEDISLGEYSSVPQVTGFIGDRLYFVSIFDDANTPWEELHWHICYYSVEDEKVHILTTVVGMRLGFVAQIENKLYAISYGSQTENDAYFKLLIIDEQTEELLGSCPLEYSPMYLCASNGVLYVTGDSTSIREEYLYAYIPSGNGLEEVEQTSLISRNTSGVVYYSSGIFAPGQEGAKP